MEKKAVFSNLFREKHEKILESFNIKIQVMVDNGGSEKDYDNPDAEANKDFHPPKFKDQYYCPNHCEGDKVYPEPGNCPVCNTSLIPIKEKT